MAEEEDSNVIENEIEFLIEEEIQTYEEEIDPEYIEIEIYNTSQLINNQEDSIQEETKYYIQINQKRQLYQYSVPPNLNNKNLQDILALMAQQLKENKDLIMLISSIEQPQ